MSRVNAFLILVLAFSSICFGASLMQRLITDLPREEKGVFNFSHFVDEYSCENVIIEHYQKVKAKIAEALYTEAYKLSFKGDWDKATETSQCALAIGHGALSWRVDAKDFIN